MTRPRRSPYLVGPVYDWAFFLLPPIAALALGFAVSITPTSDASVGFALGALIHAHLVAVFVRSHGNPAIRSRHPLRFWVVPAVLLVAIATSEWVATVAAIVATFWDVWHSGAQTFGFARIYDRNAGARSPGRKLDFALNQVIYAGPILAGATLMDHLVVLEDLEVFEDPLSNFLILVPADVSARSATLTWMVVLGGGALVVAYLVAQWRLARAGHPPSPLKVWLLCSTAVTSILAWGFNPWGEAFLIMNVFHAVQYLALVWATEHRRMGGALRVERLPVPARLRRALTLAVFLGGVAAYGVAVERLGARFELFWAVTMVVSLMHFWYDAFVWSVRRRQV